MELLLIRHGWPEIQHAGATGADPALTGRGRREADALGRYLAGSPVSAVYSSPMRRALDTAGALVARCAVPLHVDDGLCEFDHGAPTYTPQELSTASDETKRQMWRALETGVWGEHRFDPVAFERRVRAVVDGIVERHGSETVAVVCHSGVINSYLCHVLGRPLGMFVSPSYTSVTRVRASPGRAQLLTLNETTHLQLAAADLPTEKGAR